LRFLGAPVPADGLLHTRGRVLNALDARARARHHDGAACLSDGERGAGVDADEGLLDRDGIWSVTLHEIGHAVEDRLQPCLRTLARARPPPPVVDGPEAPVAFVDDPVTARCRSWIDAEDFHEERLWSLSDSPSPPSRVRRVAGNIWLTLPDGTEHELTGPVLIGRSRENDLVVPSSAV